MHRLHKNRFYSLVKHYRLNRVSLRTHGKKKRLPSSAFSAATIERVVKFIMNVAEDQALLLPGRVPGFKRNWHETAAKLHDKISSLEKLPRCVRCCGTRICWLFKVLWFVDPTLPFHCYNETSVWSLLNMPEEQQPNFKISEFTGCSKGRSCKAARKPFQARCKGEGLLQKLLQNNERYPHRILKKRWIFRETSTLHSWRNSPLPVWLRPTASLPCRPLSARANVFQDPT